ncbi:ComEC/Rec2 family competence protein [Hyalangium rubrum]|uniref:MBL fold metallo-hydrolase n=1 Tax=Hyalangium rubrum TaxID=3103134 RepID=A0ABU5H2V0_9BACT|nr:MBL fold metallo-hydrolase [Hyalangium sp. s54d21]MDY7227715.1 MBL fold metallo-hydrolase [Hyalangium sp. s54d21]
MEDSLAIYFLDVGQGDCSFIVPPGEEGPILFDCKDSLVARHFVADHNIRKLSAVVVSHLDQDHIGGLLNFLKNFLRDGGQIEQVFINQDRSPDELRNPEGPKRRLLDQLDAWAGERHFELKAANWEGAPKVVRAGAGWKVSIVFPAFRDVSRTQVLGEHAANKVSVVLRVENALGEGVLIGSDAPLLAWEEILRGSASGNRSSQEGLQRLRAGVVRIPHHGGRFNEKESGSLSGQKLYEHIRASTAVCSVGTRNTYGHPHPEHVKATVRGGSCRLLCTQLTHACHPQPERVRMTRIAAASGVEYPYRHRIKPLKEQAPPRDRVPRKPEVPCAGSIMVNLLGDQFDIEPAFGDWHTEFVESLRGPLCQSGPPKRPRKGPASPPAPAPGGGLLKTAITALRAGLAARRRQQRRPVQQPGA